MSTAMGSLQLSSRRAWTLPRADDRCSSGLSGKVARAAGLPLGLELLLCGAGEKDGVQQLFVLLAENSGVAGDGSPSPSFWRPHNSDLRRLASGVKNVFRGDMSTCCIGDAENPAGTAGLASAPQVRSCDGGGLEEPFDLLRHALRLAGDLQEARPSSCAAALCTNASLSACLPKGARPLRGDVSALWDRSGPSGCSGGCCAAALVGLTDCSFAAFVQSICAAAKSSAFDFIGAACFSSGTRLRRGERPGASCFRGEVCVDGGDATGWGCAEATTGAKVASTSGEPAAIERLEKRGRAGDRKGVGTSLKPVRTTDELMHSSDDSLADCFEDFDTRGA